MSLQDAHPVSGLIWLAKLVRQFDGDTVAVCEYLARVTTSLSAQVMQGSGKTAEEVLEGTFQLGDEVELWMRGHPERTGAEWISAAGMLLTAAAGQARCEEAKESMIQ
jgi:hypothetical protein